MWVCMWVFVRFLLEISILQFFFPFFVSSLFYWSLFCLCCFWSLYISLSPLVGSFYRYIHAIFGAGGSFSSFVSWHNQCYLIDITPNASTLGFLFSCSFSEFFARPSQEVWWISCNENSLCIYVFDEILAAELGFE